MLNFFRPLDAAKQLPYQNTAGRFQDAKRTWQIFVPIPLRNFTSTIYDILTMKKRPQEVLMNDTQHFRECLRVNVGDFTFQEAFDRTGRILNITGTFRNC
jgi:TAG lipase/steryl ester hydrolase/phospholipase A2/LPA acyltransferase